MQASIGCRGIVSRLGFRRRIVNSANQENILGKVQQCVLIVLKALTTPKLARVRVLAVLATQHHLKEASLPFSANVC
jgi:hypothetical protein